MREVSDEDLIEAIYAGMASPRLLEHALGLAMARLGANGGNFHIVSKSDLKSALFLGRGANYSEANIADYLGHWRHVNVHRKAMREVAAARPNAVFLCHENLSAETVARAAYLNEFYFPMGERWLAGSVAYEDAKYEVSLVFNRSAKQAQFGEPERALIGQLLPHIRRAASLALNLAHETGAEAKFVDGLERSGRPAFLIDGEQRVLWRNGATEAFLRGTKALELRRERLVLRDRQAGEIFARLAGAALNRNLELDNGEMLRLFDGERVFALEVMPASIPVGGVFGALSVALVSVREAQLDTTASGQLQRQFGLTKAEARLAVELAEGRSLEEVAEQRSLRQTTLRAQLREIFAKTGVSRQASLVAMVWRAGVILK